MTAQSLATADRPMVGFNDAGSRVGANGTSNDALLRTANGLDSMLVTNLQTVLDAGVTNPAGDPRVGDLQLMVAILRGTVDELRLRGVQVDTPGLDLVDELLDN